MVMKQINSASIPARMAPTEIYERQLSIDTTLVENRHRINPFHDDIWNFAHFHRIKNRAPTALENAEIMKHENHLRFAFSPQPILTGMNDGWVR